MPKRPAPALRFLDLAVALALVLPSLASAAAPAPARDPHSFARPDEVAVTHLHLDLAVDFAARRLAGSVELTLDRRRPADRLWLDTRDLDVLAVRLDGGGAAPFELGPPDPTLGRALAIPLAPGTRKVTISYRTRPEAAALQWLEPAQTADRRHPFLFSQSQAILARTWVPCQDTPAVRATYSARLRVPPGLLALMSAENPVAKRPDGVYEFRMTHPIPSYLLALAVGDLDFRPLGPTTGVYAEPSVVARAAWELADTQSMMHAVERLYGPYRWGRYDLLMLPPSFPYGGMENPRLTFASPTILAGDKSLVALVAHELAHSWSGNLVTNATWADFWLNESFTTYLENRIMEEVYGAGVAEMLAQLDRSDLVRYLEANGGGGRDSWLYADLRGRDPDETPSEVAYNKGMLLLRTLERAAGRSRWDAFLAGYFERHAFRSITTADFLADLERHLLAADPDLRRRVRVEAWVYGPGLPADEARPRSELLERVDVELARLASGVPPEQLATAGWVTQQWLRFLAGLPRDTGLDRLAALDRAFTFSLTGNAEIFTAWAVLAARVGYEPILEPLERFLLRVGRRKFLQPLYSALAERPPLLAWARAIYARAREGYHPVARATIDALLTSEG